MFKWHVVVIVALTLVFASGCKRQLSDSERVELLRHPGQEWLSWTIREREIYIRGLVDGYGGGVSSACRVTDGLLENGQPRMDGHDKTACSSPSQRCFAAVSQYQRVKVSLSTGLDVSAYTSVITKFYTRHPESRNVLVTTLMMYLRSPDVVTADDLYSSITGANSQSPSR